MIRIQTGELVGLIGDVVPFADTDTDVPASNCVQLRWFAERLHALAHTPGKCLGTAQWAPHHEPADNYAQGALFPADRWGGADDPWDVTVSLADAKAIVSTFKLPKAALWTPVTVERLHRAVRIVRDKSSEWPKLAGTYTDTFAEFDDPYKVMNRFPKARATRSLEIDPARMALFASVRNHGPMLMSMHGPEKPITVQMGDRFGGAVWPAWSSKEEDPAELDGQLDAVAELADATAGGDA